MEEEQRSDYSRDNISNVSSMQLDDYYDYTKKIPLEFNLLSILRKLTEQIFNETEIYQG